MVANHSGRESVFQRINCSFNVLFGNTCILGKNDVSVSCNFWASFSRLHSMPPILFYALPKLGRNGNVQVTRRTVSKTDRGLVKSGITIGSCPIISSSNLEPATKWIPGVTVAWLVEAQSDTVQFRGDPPDNGEACTEVGDRALQAP